MEIIKKKKINFRLNPPKMAFIFFIKLYLIPINKQIKINASNPLPLIGKNKFQKYRNKIFAIKPRKKISFNFIN